MAVSADGKIAKPMRTTARNHNVNIAAIEHHFETQYDGEDSQTPDSDSKQDRKAPIIINGKTYACASCKSGHRVGQCKHWRTKPMMATNTPGRPASGTEKRKRCTCSCDCSAKGCKCGKNCLCTQKMYMLVYIPAEGEESETSEIEQGRYEIEREVTTDLKGIPLDPEEVARRRGLKEQVHGPSKPSPPVKRRSAADTTIKSPSQAKPVGSGGCCKHKQAVEQERKNTVPTPTPLPPTVSASTHGCNCGAACACAFCPQHPNNQTSQELARQQLQFSATQHFPQHTSFVPFNAGFPQSMSCMGGIPRFAISRTPLQPSVADFGQAFPSRGGYMLAYPLHGSGAIVLRDVWNGQVPQLMPTPSSELIVPTDMNFPDNTNLDPGFDVGNALVASAGPDGWQSDFLSLENWPTVAAPQQTHVPDFLPLVKDAGMIPEMSFANATIPAAPPIHLNYTTNSNQSAYFPQHDDLLNSTTTPRNDDEFDLDAFLSPTSHIQNVPPDLQSPIMHFSDP